MVEMKPIENGELKRLSPTLLTTFDAKSPFGCQRRGYYKYVLGLPEPTTEAMTQGVHLHAMNEEYLRSGKILLGTEQQMQWFRAGQHFLDQVILDHGGLLTVETPMPNGFTVEGVPVSDKSKCDVVTTSGIIDWKTTSSIEDYGKTPGQLATDVQMLIYAKAFHPDTAEVSLTHGQYQTKGKARFHASTVKLVRNELDDNYGRVIVPLVAKVREVAKQTEVKAVPANRNACRRCPHRSICPPDKENPLMSIFDKFKKPAATPVVEAPRPTVPDRPANVVLPPDAPKSDPALAAKPVEGFQAVPPPRKMQMIDVPAPAVTAPAVVETVQAPPPPVVEEPKKRGPGRPPGSKSKSKEPVTFGPGGEVVTYNPYEILPGNKPDVLLESVTVNYGVTINMGDYNSVRIDVGMTARHGGDADKAYATVMEAVKAKVEEEMTKLKGGSK